MQRAFRMVYRGDSAAQANNVPQLRMRRSILVAFVMVGMFTLAHAQHASAAFNPTFDFKTSTTQATAHPDAQLTVINPPGSDDIRALKISLPDGFWGSMNAATKCTAFVAGAGPTGSDNCTGASKIGTVKASALVDNSTVRITGDVFLTTPFNLADAAGLGIKVQAKVGSIDLGYVRVAGRATLRGNGKGLDTTVADIPNTIDDSARGHGITNFHLTRMVVDLKSDLAGPNPLLTNSSTCSVTPPKAVAQFSSDTVIDPTPVLDVVDDVDYPTTGCDKTQFNPTISVTPTSTAAGSTSGMTAQLTLPPDNASFKQISTTLPQFGPNSPAFGEPSDMCDSNSAPLSTSVFDPTSCPPQAKVGTVTLTTPLLPSDLHGNVYLINKLPIPWLGIDINPSLPGNEDAQGITLRLLGTTSLPYLDPTCNPSLAPSGFCQTVVAASFNNIPDAPVTDVALDLDGPARAGNLGPLPGEILTVSPAADCQSTNDLTASLISSAQSLPTVISSFNHAMPTAFTGCDARPVNIGGSTVGTDILTSSSPSFTFEAGDYYCGVNVFFVGAAPCTSPYTPGLQTRGIKRVYVGTTTDAPDVSRAFAVNVATTAPEAVDPTTSIDSGPSGVTGDSTPSFTFSGNDNVTAPGALTFQCSEDGGAFLPCTTPYDFPLLDADATTVHSFEVRAVDAAGNVDLSPASAAFTVDVPFAPTLDTSVSDPQARAHPSFDMTILNASHEDLESVTLKLPDGFFGGLTGVSALCSIPTSDAGGCTDASKVGTVTTTATVDQSTVVIGGTVYLTNSRTSGDPASLSIKIPAKVGGVDMGDIILPATLSVREQAKGIDSAVVAIPKSITKYNSALAQNETIDFDARKLELHLESNNGAPQPLLTNPSSCDPASFDAEFASWDTGSGSTTASDSSPFQVTGCDALGFGPVLTTSISDSTTGGPPGESTSSKPVSASLSATLTANPGDAGIKSASVLMPKPVTMNVGLLPLPCEQAQYDVDACPATSDMGSATAISPLLTKPLEGRVYLLRAIAPKVTPRLGIKFRGGEIDTDIIAINNIPNGDTQLTTTFEVLPDVPISSFTLNVARIVSTLNQACDTPPSGWSMTGTLNAYNGKTSPVNSQLEFDCNHFVTQSVKSKWNGKKSTLKFTAKAEGKQLPTKSMKLKLPKGMKLNKKALKKKLIIKADGKKLKPKCFKAKGSDTLIVGFCGKPASLVNVEFKSGSLIGAKKKPKKRNATLTITDTSGKVTKLTLKL